MAAVDNSFPKSGRLRKRSDYLAVQRAGQSRGQTRHGQTHAGKTQHGRYFVVVCSKKGQGRLGITVSKKVGNAVIRNRVKRLVREFVRCSQSGDIGATDTTHCTENHWVPSTLDVVVIARNSASTASAHRIWADLALRRAGLQKEAG